MKTIKPLLLLIVLTVQGYSQQASIVSGGSVSGASGSFSFTVGQIGYGSDQNATFSIGEGVQQIAQTTQIFCYGANVSNLFPVGTNIKWYSVATGGTALSATTLLATKTYHYTESINGVISARTSVNVIVIPRAKAGTVSLSTPSVCINGNITFTSSAYIGDAIQWQYTTDLPLSTTNTTPQTWHDEIGATSLIYTKTNVTNAAGTKFYIRAKYTSGTCTTAYSAVKTVLVNPISVGGTVTGGGVICSGAGGILTLKGNVGSKIQWLSSENGIDYAPVSLAITAKYTVTGLTTDTWYKAQVTSGACSSALSNAVKFEIGNSVTAGNISTTGTLICKGTTTTFYLSGNYGKILWEKSTDGTTWTSATNSSTTFVTPPLLIPTYFRATSYIGTSVTNNCYVAQSNSILVNIIAAPVSKGITGNTIPAVNNGTTALKALQCSDTTKILSVTSGSTGNLQWQWSTTSTTSGFTDITGETGTSYTISLPSKATGANYYKAKFTNSCGASVYSNAITVYYTGCTTTAKNEADIETTLFDAVAYPNPYSESFNLNVTTSRTGNFDFAVYDMTGRLIEQREVNYEDINQVRFGGNYATGIYNIIVNQGIEAKTLRVIKK